MLVVARHQVAQTELLRVNTEIEDKKQKIVHYAVQLRRSQEAIANVLKKHQVVLQNAKQKAKGALCCRSSTAIAISSTNAYSLM